MIESGETSVSLTTDIPPPAMRRYARQPCRSRRHCARPPASTTGRETAPKAARSCPASPLRSCRTEACRSTKRQPRASKVSNTKNIRCSLPAPTDTTSSTSPTASRRSSPSWLPSSLDRVDSPSRSHSARTPWKSSSCYPSRDESPTPGGGPQLDNHSLSSRKPTPAFSPNERTDPPTETVRRQGRERGRQHPEPRGLPGTLPEPP